MSKIAIETGRRIRNYRVQMNMSQETFAEKCGLHPTYIG
ncbi:MAG: helix-turn-helix transcriptional regulator, partial [Ruminococcus sp.]|nr:helix-turn-helix transcriptional regulator [Ruminococcus sp.]